MKKNLLSIVAQSTLTLLISLIITLFAPQIILGQLLDSTSSLNKDSISIFSDSLNKSSLTTASIDSYKKSSEDSIKEDERSNSKKWYLKFDGEAFFNVIVGVLIGVITSFFSQAYLRRLDKKRRREEYVGLLKVILEEVKRNLNLECQLHAYFHVGIMPTFGLSFFISDNVFKEFTKVCENYDLLRLLFHKYFEYRHIQNRIDRTIKRNEQVDEILIQRDSIKNSNEWRLATGIYHEERLGTCELIRGNVRGSLDLYNVIVKEIKKFEKSQTYSELPLSYLDQKYDEFQKTEYIIKVAQQNKINLNAREKPY